MSTQGNKKLQAVVEAASERRSEELRNDESALDRTVPHLDLGAFDLRDTQKLKGISPSWT